MNTVISTEPADTPVEQAQLKDAYKRGRHDAEADVNERVVAKEHEKAVRLAYDRGRRDERARRHGSPLLTFILVLAAAAGVLVLYLAAREGSFSRGGQVVDQSVASAAATTSHATQDVTNKAGSALQNAGARLKKAPDTNN